VRAAPGRPHTRCGQRKGIRGRHAGRGPPASCCLVARGVCDVVAPKQNFGSDPSFLFSSLSTHHAGQGARGQLPRRRARLRQECADPPPLLRGGRQPL
jgi:hypothetical protein